MQVESGARIQPQVRRRVSSKWRDRTVPYIFITPFILSFFVFFLFPAVYALVLSFYKYKGYGTASFVGVDNYVSLLTYGTFWLSVKNTLFYLVGHLVPVMVISFLLAVAIHSKLVKWKAVFKPLIFLPQIMASVAAALIWKVIFSTHSGVINNLLGTQYGFLEDPSLMKWSVVVLIIWRAVGWFMVIFLAGLTTVGEEVQEAATIDGANGWQRMVYITVPLMKPIFLFAFLMNTIHSLKIYNEPNLLVGGGLTSVPAVAPIMNILTDNIRSGNFGMASAVGWILFVMIYIVSIIQYKLLGGNKTE
ncbi:sugar ABC transporter permease [Paenibacillus doosanensis]|uniref:carbohydrate ABC transporter permease n=1 Tax=Paenibacillus doosanensis TaxID=1229154 RepID=UPI00217FDF2E|nr:sugar ABC transporter permease [Paenibacillus doosanensis]MCS7461454.1 sugar ABC transporter permease [Paenibacillus doosanensis]